MDSLSEEISQRISMHLSPQALAAWSATSRHWRDVLNRDECWQRFCDPSLVDYLLDTPCVVEPGFISPEEPGSDLNPLCQWRLHYMRQNHLWNNWRAGRYSGRQIRFEAKEYYLSFIPGSQISTKKVAKATFYNEHYFIGYLNFIIQMWDLRGEPVLYVENPCFIYSKLKVLALHIHGDKLVVVQSPAVVLVIQISLTSSTWPVVHVFRMHHKKECSPEEANEIMQMNFSTDDLFDGTMVEDIFIGIKSCRADKMHIWNIDSAVKVKEAECEEPQQWYIHSVCSGVSTKNVVVTMTIRDDLWSNSTTKSDDQSYNLRSRLMIYSLSELSFLSFIFNSENDYYPDSMIDEKFIAINTNNGCLVYNYQTQDLIATTAKYDCAQFVKETIMFCNGQILKQVVFSTKEEKLLLDSDDRITSLDLVSDKYTALLVSPSRGCRDNMDTIRIIVSGSQDTWEISSPLRQPSPTIPIFLTAGSFCSTKGAIHKLEFNKTFTKMVYKYGSPLHVYYFW